jgi:putative transposase
MARRLRLHLPGIPVHVIQRGNNRCNCFFDDSDRLLYLSLLAGAARTEGCAIHAFVLMTNHVHLLASTQADNAISRMMKRLGQHYVRTFNRTHQRTGTLWEGRFRSSVVDTRTYLLTCYRYIENNPVRAGMVTRPGDYPWSSFRYNAFGQASDFLCPHAAYSALGPTDEERLATYRAFFATRETDADVDLIRECVNGGLALGPPEFIETIEQLSGRPAARKPGGRPRRQGLIDTVSSADNLALTPVLGSV